MPHLRDVLKLVVYARHDGSLPGEQPAWQAHQRALHVVPLLRNEFVCRLQTAFGKVPS